MNIKSTIALRTSVQLSLRILDSLSEIDEADFEELVEKARQSEKRVKGICDNAQRGNFWMTCFFYREWLEELAREG